MSRVSFVLAALRHGFLPSWNLVGQLLSVLALLAIFAGIQLAGVPLRVSLVATVLAIVGVAIEGAYRLWRDGQAAFEALHASTPAEGHDLIDRLQEELHRGRRLLDRARISDDGTAGALESWENDVGMMLERAGRQDLVQSFEVKVLADRTRALISGRWSTRSRLERRLQTLADIINHERPRSQD